MWNCIFQVFSRYKMRPIGIADVEVSDDRRVELQYILVNVVSGVRVELVSERQMPSALVAKVVTSHQLTRKHQVRLR